MVICPICSQRLERITNSHLKIKHNITPFDFSNRFPKLNRGYVPWNRGKTKNTHPLLAALSNRLKKQQEWNFSDWQRAQRISNYKKYKIEKSEDWSELVGAALGDGHIEEYPRTERIRIYCNSNDRSYVAHIAKLVHTVLKKRPKIIKRKEADCTNVELYQCNISRRLELLIGRKGRYNTKIPFQIKYKPDLLVKCLKGLLESDGCFYEDPKNYTSVIEFKNNSLSLLNDVYQALRKLGYSPQFGKKYIRLAKKKEVYDFINLIGFRDYKLGDGVIGNTHDSGSCNGGSKPPPPANPDE